MLNTACIMKATEDIFRAYDIRGVYGEELDAEIGERVGLAFGNFLRKQYNGGKISIGCDARVSSPELQMAVSKGVSRAGFDVDIIGFEIGSDFVVGYGLDLNQRYRNLGSLYRKKKN